MNTSSPRDQARELRSTVPDALEDIIFKKSFGRGAIVLASGRASDFYFDMKPTMLDPEGAHLIAERLFAAIVAAGADFVGGLEMGAVPITGAVCQFSFQQKHPIHGFFVRKKAKEYGARKSVEGLPKGQTLAGKRVVVVEDVTTSGASALVAVEACKAEDADVVLVISIVDRQEGAAQLFAEKNLPFKALYAASTFLTRQPG